MDTDFFEKAERVEVATSRGPVLLPLLIREATMAAGFFSVPEGAAQEALPFPDLVPLGKWRGRAVLGFGVLSCRDAATGPFKAFALAVPVKFRPASSSRLIPSLRMASTLSFDLFPWELAVDDEKAAFIGREIWGYPLREADVTLEEGPERVTGRLFLEGKQALSLTLRRKSPNLKTYLEFNTYSVRDGRLLWTPVRGLSLGVARSFLPGAARLDLGDHELAERLRGMGLSNRADLAVYASGLQLMLPVAERTYEPTEHDNM